MGFLDICRTAPTGSAELGVRDRGGADDHATDRLDRAGGFPDSGARGNDVIHDQARAAGEPGRRGERADAIHGAFRRRETRLIHRPAHEP
jgi:hypothetical protein